MNNNSCNILFLKLFDFTRIYSSVEVVISKGNKVFNKLDIIYRSSSFVNINNFVDSLENCLCISNHSVIIVV